MNHMNPIPWLYERYKKSCCQTGCSPAAVILGLLVVFGIVCYVYRHIIEMTLIYAGLTILCAGVAVGLVYLGVTMYGFRKERKLRTEGQHPVTAELVPFDEDAMDMEATADILADDAIELLATNSSFGTGVKVSKK
jgi:hypothetical protein